MISDKSKPKIVYCATDEQGNIREMMGSSTKNTYYINPTQLRKVIAYHNKCRPDQQLKMTTFELVATTEEVIPAED